MTSGAADLDADLQDVSESEAQKVLQQLAEDGHIDEDQAEKYLQWYSKLHKELVKAMSHENTLLEQAKGLKRVVEEEAKRAAAAAAANNATGVGADNEALVMLREDADAAQSEAALAQERQQLLQLEVTEQQRHRNELSAQIAELQEEANVALQPVITALRAELVSITAGNEEEHARMAKEQRSLDDTKGRMKLLVAEMDALKGSVAEERAALDKVTQVPEKARRQNDILISALKTLQAQHESQLGRIAELEAAARGVAQQAKDIQDEHARTLSALERGHIMIENKERHADDVRRDLELAGIEADKILADSVDLDMRLKAMATEVKMNNEVCNRRNKERDTALRKYKKAETELKLAQDAVPSLRNAHETLLRDKSAQEATIKREGFAVEELKAEVDVYMAEFLKEECIGQDKTSLFKMGCQEVALLEAHVSDLRREEGHRLAQLATLATQRDRIARLCSTKIAKLREADEASKIREVERTDLSKIERDTGSRIRDFEKLYNLVKNQRNKFVNLIQAANQGIAEMRDKLKILHNELEILHGEATAKDKLLGQARTQHTSAVADRDGLRAELTRLGITFQGKQDSVEEQVAELDKLNAIINGTEREVLALKKRYEAVIEARNYTGIMLIDRNDELCILYEKANIQEAVLQSGELELKHREDEVRMLKLEVAELQRAVEVTKRQVPVVPLLDEDVALLQKALLEARREAEALSLALENPDNKARWRQLGGKIPETAELVAKIQQLEERLNDKKEQLLEKELILEEVTALSDRLRAQASEGRDDTLDLAKKVNEYQQRLRGVTRKIMALVSELSMTQATALKLAGERNEVEQVVATARQRVEQGEPPTDDAEKEWERMLREAAMVEDLTGRIQAMHAILENKSSPLQTTAEARPNAYIPDDIGIPKPYGSFAPFKPTDTGSTMRHIRKPQPREVVI